MNKLSQYLVDQILLEREELSNTVVVYAGRFQPMHNGHAAVYKLLVKEFGSRNVFIGTSNKVELPKSPFNFKEKKLIMIKLFGIPSNKIVQVKNPFQPNEILNKYPENDTAYVAVVSKKDSSRLSNSKYFSRWEDSAFVPMSEGGYYHIVEMQAGGISGTEVRNNFKTLDLLKRKKFFKKLYGKFDQKMYDLINNKLNEGFVLTPHILESALEHIDINKLLKEASTTGTTGGVKTADDGPSFVYRDFESFKIHSARRAADIGYTAVNFILDPKGFTSTVDYPTYPNGPVGEVSFGPKGIVPPPDENERPEWNIIRNQNHFDSWNTHISRFVNLLGWEIIDYIGAKESLLSFDDEFIASLDNNPDESSFSLNESLLPHQYFLNSNSKILLTCGGAAGHMNHPFDDMQLTFGDLKRIVELGLSGYLDIESDISLKSDGQNIAISWKNGKLIAARNKGHIKNFGQNAMDVSGVKSMFSGRGAISDAFGSAMDNLNSSISKLSSTQQNKIFQEGKKFMSLEIIFPATTNVIPYGQNLLLFHGTIEYDESGNQIGTSPADSRTLSGMIKQANANVQKTFNIKGLPIVKLPRSKNFDDQKSKYISKIDRLRKQFNLKDSDEVSLYHQEWWEKFITNQAKKFKYSMPNSVLVGLIKRWAFNDKSYSIRDMKRGITNIKFSDWSVMFDKKDHKGQLKKNIEPFETLFLQVGADILLNIEPMIVVNPDESIRKMRNSLAKAIVELRNSKDINKIKKLKTELQRLNAAGGTKKIVPVEGIVFRFKGNTYKLTGVFGPLNSILGILRF